MADYSSQAGKAASKYGIPTDIFSAVINNVSGWDSSMIGLKGEVGLGQLSPQIGMQVGIPDIYTPQGNLDAAAKYLSSLYTDKGNDVADWQQAVQTYISKTNPFATNPIALTQEKDSKPFFANDNTLIDTRTGKAIEQDENEAWYKPITDFISWVQSLDIWIVGLLVLALIMGLFAVKTLVSQDE